MEKKRLIVGISGASGAPLAIACLQELRAHPEIETYLIVTHGGEVTLAQETGLLPEQVCALADCVCDNADIGAGPASGTFRTAGMLIVPCSMKTAAGICSGYSDNLLLRAADVTLKEQRTLVLAARESPLSAIHLRNLCQLAALPGVHIIPPMVSYYHHPHTLEDLNRHITARLLEPFGIEMKGYCRWTDQFV